MRHDNSLYFIDMIHDNPGEEPFRTRYRNPEALVELGFNGQVGRNILSTVTFDSLGLDLFSEGSEERAWFDLKTQSYRDRIAKIKSAGLLSLFHIDLFMFPRIVVDHFKDEMMEDGRISINRSCTQNMCRVMIRELFQKYPLLDGLIVRVGETYLHDTSFHTGNRAVKYNYIDSDRSQEQSELITLINLLRDEVCVKASRSLIFRTWDCFPDRFHADRNYYLKVTNNIEPHNKLLFSVKHTALDFWRHVRFNPTLMTGKHQQVVEVQCQREYEGKGAYPMYHMGGVINGFSECTNPKGLKDIINHPLFGGLFTWSRGGGWRGPYIENEFWINLNVEVLSKWFSDTSQKEKDIFMEVVRKKGLTEKASIHFRKLCELTQEAVLKGRYCRAFDAHYEEAVMPTMNWLRDDHIGGERQIKPIFEYLYKNQLIQEAILEKKESCDLWMQIEQLADKIHFPDDSEDEFFHVSVRYGCLLFKIIYLGWKLYSFNYLDDVDREKIDHAILEYDTTLASYKRLAKDAKCCPTLYQFSYRVKEYDDEDSVFVSEDNTMIYSEGLDELIARYR